MESGHGGITQDVTERKTPRYAAPLWAVPKIARANL